MDIVSLQRRISGVAALPVPLVIAWSGIASAGCASAGPRAESAENWEVLSMEELKTVIEYDTYSAIRELRPEWLLGRGLGAPTAARLPGERQVQVYVDGVLVRGGPTVLRQIRSEDVLEIRHLNGIDATTRFGADHGAGAILVVTRSTPSDSGGRRPQGQ